MAAQQGEGAVFRGVEGVAVSAHEHPLDCVREGC